MRRGTRPTAAGSPTPGTSPLLARATLTYLPQLGSRIVVFLRTISNRHLVQLEIAATPAESTSSLFLIDPKQAQFRKSIKAFHAGPAFALPVPVPKISSHPSHGPRYYRRRFCGDVVPEARIAGRAT